MLSCCGWQGTWKGSEILEWTEDPPFSAGTERLFKNRRKNSVDSGQDCFLSKSISLKKGEKLTRRERCPKFIQNKPVCYPESLTTPLLRRSNKTQMKKHWLQPSFGCSCGSIDPSHSTTQEKPVFQKTRVWSPEAHPQRKRKANQVSLGGLQAQQQLQQVEVETKSHISREVNLASHWLNSFLHERPQMLELA